MKKQLKKFAAASVALTIMLSTGALQANEPAADPFSIPLRDMFEYSGANVGFDQETRQITVTHGDRELVLTPGSEHAYLNGEVVSLDEPVIIEGGRSYIRYSDAALLFANEGLTEGVAQAILMTNAVREHIEGMSIALVHAPSCFTWVHGFGNGIDEHTMFGIGSNAKPITAIAVMQLVEQGLVDLDTPLVEYLPDFYMSSSPHGGDFRNITPRMVLTHTAGLPRDLLGYGATTHTAHDVSHFNNMLANLANYAMAMPEDATLVYSNIGFALMGLLVAELTGDTTPFDDFVAYTYANIFEPAGMNNTTFLITEAHEPYMAMPYLTVGARDDFLFINNISTGATFSSAYDMARLMHIILGDGAPLLTAASFAEMTTIHDFDFSLTPMNMASGLGFFQTADMAGVQRFGHGGNVIHYHSSFLFDVDSGVGVFVAVNTGAAAGLNDVVAQSMLYFAMR